MKILVTIDIRLSKQERSAWYALTVVIHNCLGIHRSEDWQIGIDNMLVSFESIGVNIPLKINLLVIQWDKEGPFECALDDDDPQYITWIYERAMEWANKFYFSGVTYRLVQGVIKHIIPAVASTNAVIAAACATEVFKLATSCYDSMSNYLNFNDIDGIYTYTYAAEKSESCLTCSNVPQMVNIEDPNTTTLEDVIKILCESVRFQMKQPGITTIMDGKNKTLYMSTDKSIEEKTRANLTQSLGELGLKDGQHIMVTDQTSPSTITLSLKYNANEVEMN